MKDRTFDTKDSLATIYEKAEPFSGGGIATNTATQEANESRSVPTRKQDGEVQFIVVNSSRIAIDGDTKNK